MIEWALTNQKVYTNVYEIFLYILSQTHIKIVFVLFDTVTKDNNVQNSLVSYKCITSNIFMIAIYQIK